MERLSMKSSFLAFRLVCIALLHLHVEAGVLWPGKRIYPDPGQIDTIQKQ